MDEIKFINRKGGRVLLFNGRQFYRQRCYKNGDTIWNCCKVRSQKCRGSVTLRGSRIIKEKSHVCLVNYARNEVDASVYELKEDIQNTDTPIPQLYKETKKGMKSKGLHFVTPIPTLNNIKTALYASRKRTNFKTPSEVAIPSKFEEDFLLSDYTNDNCRIILFCSTENRNNIKHVQEFFGDGTFQSCPAPFAQLYSIHGDIGSTTAKTKVVPFVYALMSDRKEQSYIVLFEMIKSQIPGWSPQKFHIDFETAASNALMKVFSDIKIKFCYYHFTKSLWKKAKTLKLNRKRDRRVVGLCSALALLPEINIEEGWMYIKTESSNKPKICKFMTYMETFWLKCCAFRSQWCVSSERHRTNNTVESWNSIINKEMKKKGPISLLRLLNALVKLEHEYELQRDLEDMERRQEYIDDDDLIMQAQLELLHNEIRVGFFLEKLR